MTGARAAFAAAAATLVGTPFRLHGRDPLRGLDCVGVVTASLALIGRPVAEAMHYSLRQTDFAPLLPLLERAGFSPTDRGRAPGDVIACVPGPAQLHLVVCVAGGFVHAHAGLRRVVITPGPLPWRTVSTWRLADD